jgi:hypothetical protein
MEVRQTGIEQNRTTFDPVDFVKKHALVEEVDSKPVLSIKGAQMLTALQASLGQSNPETLGVIQ